MTSPRPPPCRAAISPSDAAVAALPPPCGPGVWSWGPFSFLRFSFETGLSWGRCWWGTGQAPGKPIAGQWAGTCRPDRSQGLGAAVQDAALIGPQPRPRGRRPARARPYLPLTAAAGQEVGPGRQQELPALSSGENRL